MIKEIYHMYSDRHKFRVLDICNECDRPSTMYIDSDHFYVSCESCGRGTAMHSNPAAAMVAWNIAMRRSK